MTQWFANKMVDVLEYTNPRFALFGTVNFMRALAIQVDPYLLDDSWRHELYSGVEQACWTERAKMLVLQQLMFSLHSLAGLMAASEEIENKADISRSAIDAWFDTISNSANAMCLVSGEGNERLSHASSKLWGKALVEKGLVLPPFSIFVSDLTRRSREEQLAHLRGFNKSDLNREPASASEAYGCLVSYLSGTCDYVTNEAEELIRGSDEFKALGVDSFRTNAAKVVRDSVLAKISVNFLDEVLRYRGKIKDRDCLFLSYGHDNFAQIDQFVRDLVVVSRVFFMMGCAYCEARLGSSLWNEFRNDVNQNSRLSLEIK